MKTNKKITPEKKLILAQVSKEKQLIISEKRKCINEDDKVIIAKLEVLRCLMLGEVIDESKSVIGGEPFRLNLFNEGELYTLKGKVMDLIKRL